MAPSAPSRSEQRHEWPSLPLDRLRLQVVSTSWRLHPLQACRPCSIPDPLLGSPLQSFTPYAQPYAVPDAFPLLTFPPSSGCCSARKSATRLSGLDQIRARSSPGYLPLQGVLSHGDGPAFTGPPLLRFNHPDHDRQEDRRSRVSLAKSKACLSRDCRPSWGLWPREPSHLFECRGILESPPRGPGVRHRLLVSPSSNP